MTLIIDLFDPAEGPYSYLNAIEVDAAGFESYRWKVWGAVGSVDADARFLPQLRAADLWVYPAELDAFAEECRRLHAAAPALARAIWGAPEGAEALRRYLDRFLAAIALARQRGAGVSIS